MGGPTVHVLVCGEELRGDDGAGPIAARRLPPDVRSLASVTEVGQLSVEALLAVPDDAAVIVVDAAIGVPAGDVVCLPLAALARRESTPRPASTHALPAPETLALAEELRGRPLAGTFIGLGGARFGMGEELSAPVAGGIETFVSAIESEVRRLAAERPPSDAAPTSG